MRVCLFLLFYALAHATPSVADIQARIDKAYSDERDAIQRDYLEFTNNHVILHLERDIKAHKVTTCLDKSLVVVGSFCDWWKRHFEGVACTWNGSELCFSYSKDYAPQAGTDYGYFGLKQQEQIISLEQLCAGGNHCACPGGCTINV